MSLNKKDIRKKYSSVEEFKKNEDGKHRCECGCNKVIELKKSHYWNGIPRFIFGHAARMRTGTKKYDQDLYYSVEDIAKLAGVSDQTVRLWNRSKKIKADTTAGRKKLYLKTSIESFLTERPERALFDMSEFYSVQDLKNMGVSRSKLRALVRAGTIQEPKHHARKTHYLKQEIEKNLDQIKEDLPVSIPKPTNSRAALGKLKTRIKELEVRVKMLEDCLLNG
ncbi:helix-turn-helix domain-containing protein [bacterium]|nr:helix-turn-helix domain-containing protein [candidate division CSSED10-310 bacterium]